jgi:hypothetical protein
MLLLFCWECCCCCAGNVVVLLHELRDKYKDYYIQHQGSAFILLSAYQTHRQTDTHTHTHTHTHTNINTHTDTHTDKG